MIILSTTTDKIQAVLAGAITTNQLQCVSSWRDITGTPTYTAGRSVASTNNTTLTDIITAPAASTQRVIDKVSVYNSDTASALVTISYSDNGTLYTLWKATLATGERVAYENGVGWQLYNASGQRVSVGNTGPAGAAGADGAVAVTEAEIDFGFPPVREDTFTITDAAVSTSSNIIVTQSGKAATGRDADENEMDRILFAAVPGTGSFTLYATSVTGPVSGKFKINYVLS